MLGGVDRFAEGHHDRHHCIYFLPPNAVSLVQHSAALGIVVVLAIPGLEIQDRAIAVINQALDQGVLKGNQRLVIPQVRLKE